MWHNFLRVSTIKCKKMNVLEISVVIWGGSRLSQMGQPGTWRVVGSGRWWKASWRVRRGVWRIVTLSVMMRMIAVRVFGNPPRKRGQDVGVGGGRGAVAAASSVVDVEEVLVHHHHARGRVMTEKRGRRGRDDRWRNWAAWWRHTVWRKVYGTCFE